MTQLDEVKSVEPHAENKTETGGKDNSYEDRHLSIKEYSKQMGFLEKVIDEQRKLIEEHNHKLATIEKILQRRLPQENASLSESDQKEGECIFCLLTSWYLDRHIFVCLFISLPHDNFTMSKKSRVK